MRILIVGAGGVGAMAAWRLSRAGHEVIALEQFSTDHDRGSSYGDSRIVRRVYPDPFYTALMADAYPLWEELEKEADESLFVRSGGIFFGPADHPLIFAAQQALEENQIPFEVLNASDCRRRFQGVVLQPNEAAVYEPSMGFVDASRAVRASTELAKRHGALFHENQSVTSLQPEGKGVRITTTSGSSFSGDRVLICAGAWTRPLLAILGWEVPLTVTRQPYLYLKPSGQQDPFLPGRFPVWIDAAANFYGFPMTDSVPGMKLGLHDFGTECDPDTVDRTVHARDRETLIRYAERRFPRMSSEIVHEKVCLYTVTPDNDFIMDTLPGMQKSWFISACSGHGFKFTPLLGEIARCLLTEAALPVDLTRFSRARFTATIAAANRNEQETQQMGLT